MRLPGLSRQKDQTGWRLNRKFYTLVGGVILTLREEIPNARGRFCTFQMILV